MRTAIDHLSGLARDAASHTINLSPVGNDNLRRRKARFDHGSEQGRTAGSFQISWKVLQLYCVSTESNLALHQSPPWPWRTSRSSICRVQVYSSDHMLVAFLRRNPRHRPQWHLLSPFHQRTNAKRHIPVIECIHVFRHKSGILLDEPFGPADSFPSSARHLPWYNFNRARPDQQLGC